MGRIRSENTSPERSVRRVLHTLGFRYRLHVKSLPGCADIVFPGRRKAIFVNGCFWHQHPGCQDAFVPKSRQHFWIPKLRRNLERDRENREKLRKLGWLVCTIWECELSRAERVRRKLLKFLG